MAGFSLPVSVSLVIVKNNSRKPTEDQPSTNRQFYSQTEEKGHLARHAVDRALANRCFIFNSFRARHAAESCLRCFNLTVLHAVVTVGKV